MDKNYQKAQISHVKHLQSLLLFPYIRSKRINRNFNYLFYRRWHYIRAIFPNKVSSISLLRWRQWFNLLILTLLMLSKSTIFCNNSSIVCFGSTLSHFKQVFHVRRNQLAGFCKQMLWKKHLDVDDHHFYLKCHSSTGVFSYIWLVKTNHLICP